MSKQILVRMSEGAYKSMKNYMQMHGFESDQNFIREAIRKAMYEDSGLKVSEIKALKKKLKNTDF